MHGVGLMVRVVVLGSLDPEFKSLLGYWINRRWGWLCLSSFQDRQNECQLINSAKSAKFILGFTAIFSSGNYTTLSNMLLSFFVPVVHIHYDILKNSKFPVWNYFQFCLIARQVDRVKILSHSSLRMCDLEWILSQNMVKQQTSLHSCSNSCPKYITWFTSAVPRR